jgi:ferredoxin
VSEESERSKAGRMLQSKRRTRLRDCVQCGQPFYGLATRIYCSHKCAQRAYVLKKKREQEEGKENSI